MSDSRAGAKLRRLIAEISDELSVLRRLGDEVADASAQASSAHENAALQALLAVRLHGYYTALESIIQRIERTTGAEPAGGDWHLELLTGATREMKGLRPAILPVSVLEPLRELLSFRHFFRHAYAVELDALKLAKIVACVRTARPQVEAALVHFVAFLEQAAQELES